MSVDGEADRIAGDGGMGAPASFAALFLPLKTHFHTMETCIVRV